MCALINEISLVLNMYIMNIYECQLFNQLDCIQYPAIVTLSLSKEHAVQKKPCFINQMICRLHVHVHFSFYS